MSGPTPSRTLQDAKAPNPRTALAHRIMAANPPDPRRDPPAHDYFGAAMLSPVEPFPYATALYSITSPSAVAVPLPSRSASR